MIPTLRHLWMVLRLRPFFFRHAASEKKSLAPAGDCAVRFNSVFIERQNNGLLGGEFLPHHAKCLPG
jgi:hypothetical protein